MKAVWGAHGRVSHPAPPGVVPGPPAKRGVGPGRVSGAPACVWSPLGEPPAQGPTFLGLVSILKLIGRSIGSDPGSPSMWIDTHAWLSDLDLFDLRLGILSKGSAVVP